MIIRPRYPDRSARDRRFRRWQTFTSWVGRMFGAAPGGDARLVVVFDGPPAQSQLVAMRLETEGVLEDRARAIIGAIEPI